MTSRSLPQLWINKGSKVESDGHEYVILAIADVDVVIAKDLASGNKVLLKMGGLGPPRAIDESQPPPPSELDLLEVPEALWEVAEARRRWIDPLLNCYSTYSEALAKQIAIEAQVSRATIYRWVAAFRRTALLSSLLPNMQLRGGKGGSRILPEVEAIIKDALENFHDTDQKPSIADTVLEIRRLCSNANLSLPATNTVRERLRRTQGRERTLRREGEAAAYARHDRNRGSIPDADWPLAMVQIDHTLLSVIIVDDKYRQPINRAWITLAIDVYSRVCLGMYLSLDAPSAMSAGTPGTGILTGCVSNFSTVSSKSLRSR
jgi:putative transposase